MLGVYSVRRFTPYFDLFSSLFRPSAFRLPCRFSTRWPNASMIFIQNVEPLRCSNDSRAVWKVLIYPSSMSLHYGWWSCHFEQTLTRYVSSKWSNLFKAFSKQSLPVTEDRVVQLRFAAITGYHTITKSKIRGMCGKGKHDRMSE